MYSYFFFCFFSPSKMVEEGGCSHLCVVAHLFIYLCMYVVRYIYNNHHPVNTKLLAWKSVKEVSALERCSDVNMCVSFGAPIDRTGTTDRPTVGSYILLHPSPYYLRDVAILSPASLPLSPSFLYLPIFIYNIYIFSASLCICSNLFWPNSPLSLHFQSPSSINGVGLAFG
jgi:hypothetical protein